MPPALQPVIGCPVFAARELSHDLGLCENIVQDTLDHMIDVAQGSLKGRGKHTFKTTSGFSITIKGAEPKKKEVKTAEEVEEAM